MDPFPSTGRPRWWPADMDSQQGDDGVGASSSAETGYAGGDPDPEPNLPRQRQTGETGETGETGQEQRHYKPRTCRICLEVVQPTTEIDDSGSRLFGSKVRVKYLSEDPELGRLLCPCKCKGSQKYVHEGCLRAWRQAAPLSDRNFWRCPTCHFEYRIERLRWARWLSSRWTRVALTFGVVVFSIFMLGFIADPIINVWLDPFGSIADTITVVITDVEGLREPAVDLDEPATWSYHFLKGLFSLGLLGFVKSFLAMSPWQWFNLRHGGVFGGARARRGGTGRDRLDNINWALIVIGLITFLGVSIHYLFHPIHAPRS